jgi:hypothetical protein
VTYQGVTYASNFPTGQPQAPAKFDILPVHKKIFIKQTVIQNTPVDQKTATGEVGKCADDMTHKHESG